MAVELAARRAVCWVDETVVLSEHYLAVSSVIQRAGTSAVWWDCQWAAQTVVAMAASSADVMAGD